MFARIFVYRNLGNLEEARILVEAGGNASGNIDFTTATVVVD
jgi:hypothetical protein